MSGRFHLGEDGPRPCRAKQGNCPLKDEEGNQVPHGSEDEMVALQEKQLGETYGVMPEGARRGALPAVANESLPVELQVTEEGVERYRAWAEAYRDRWDAHYRSVGREDQMKGDSQVAALAGITKDGAPYPSREDGSVVLEAGDYVMISSDGWYSTDAPESDHEDLNAWVKGAWDQPVPGCPSGAYLQGKPAFLLASMGLGENHGYDGEILLPRSTWEAIKDRPGVSAGDDMYPATFLRVEQDTVIYGELGNPGGPIAGDLYSRNYDSMGAEANAFFEGERPAEGSILGGKHPHVTVVE